MPATKVNLSQMVDLAVGIPEIYAIDVSVLHTLLHAMLRRLNIVDVQADLNDFDRDFLSASKDRKLSVLSDVDSGRSDDAEDTLSEMSSMPSASASPNTGKRTPYHLLEIKVAKMQAELERITSVPIPIGEMWLNMHMQLMGRVETNEKGITKSMSMIENMTKEMQYIRDEHQKQMDQIKGFFFDQMMRLNEIEKSLNEMNDKFNTLPSPINDFAQCVTRTELEDVLQGTRVDLERELPSPDDFTKCVTLAGLEEDLQGIRQDWEKLQQPTKKIVIEMSSQIDPVTSRPTSSRSVSCGVSLGPSEAAQLEFLETLGKLGESREALTRQVVDLEVDLIKKLVEGPLDGLRNVSSELLEQLLELKEKVDAIAAAREEISEPLEMIAPPPSLRSLTSNEDVLQHEKKIQTLAIANLQMEVSMLEDQLNQIQELINLDTTRWESQHGTNFGKEVEKIVHQYKTDPSMETHYVVNEQYDIRDNNMLNVYVELKNKDENQLLQTKSEPEEIPLVQIKSGGFNYEDMDHDALQNAKREEFKKADKRILDLNKVNNSLFDTKAIDTSKKIQEILDRMAVNKEAWDQHCKIFSDDIDRKLDCLELDRALKEWLLSRLMVLNDELKKRNQASVEWVDDDAAGIRRQLIQKCHCISSDRPIDIVPTGNTRILVESKFGNDVEAFQKQRNASNDNTIIKEDEEMNIYPLYKYKVDVQGADGNIYKGRMDRLESKLPSMTQVTQDPSSMQKRDNSPQPIREKVMQEESPSTSKMFHSPRPSPQSAHQTVSPQAMAGSSNTTLCQSIISVEQAQQKARENRFYSRVGRL